MLLWHHALRPSGAKLGALVAAGAPGACLALLEAPGAAAPERICALGILLGVARAGEAGRIDVAGARTARVRLQHTCAMCGYQTWWKGVFLPTTLKPCMSRVISGVRCSYLCAVCATLGSGVW